MSFFLRRRRRQCRRVESSKTTIFTVAVFVVSFSCFGLFRVRRGRRVLLLAVAAAAKEALSRGRDKGEDKGSLWRSSMLSVVVALSVPLRRGLCGRRAHLHGVVGGHGPEAAAVRAAHFI